MEQFQYQSLFTPLEDTFNISHWESKNYEVWEDDDPAPIVNEYYTERIHFEAPLAESIHEPLQLFDELGLEWFCEYIQFEGDPAAPYDPSTATFESYFEYPRWDEFGYDILYGEFTERFAFDWPTHFQSCHEPYQLDVEVEHDYGTNYIEFEVVVPYDPSAATFESYYEYPQTEDEYDILYGEFTERLAFDWPTHFQSIHEPYQLDIEVEQGYVANFIEVTVPYDPSASIFESYFEYPQIPWDIYYESIWNFIDSSIPPFSVEQLPYMNLVDDFEEEADTEGYNTYTEDLYGALPAEINAYDDVHHTNPFPYFQGIVNLPGGYIGTYGHTQTPAAVSGNIIFYIPIYIPYPVHVTEMGIYISQEPNAYVEAVLGIYTCSRGKPLTLIYQNLIALNTLGYRATPASVYLSPGFYFLAFWAGSAVGLQCWKGDHTCDILGNETPDGTATRGVVHFQNTSPGTWDGDLATPVDPDDLTASNGETVRILLRVW